VEKSVVAPAKTEARYLSPQQEYPWRIFFQDCFHLVFWGLLAVDAQASAAFFTFAPINH
jgi:hypothetical protein